MRCPLQARRRIVLPMVTSIPIGASGPREPAKPRAVSAKIRRAVLMMIYGSPNDADGAPVDFIAAAKACGIRLDLMRAALDRPEVRRLLHAERRIFRSTIAAGNEAALKRVRDRSENGMAVISAVRTIESMDEEKAAGPHGHVQQCGFVIVLRQEATPGAPMAAPIVIDALPIAEQRDHVQHVGPRFPPPTRP